MLLELVIVLTGTAAFCGWVFFNMYRRPEPPRRRPPVATRRAPDK